MTYMGELNCRMIKRRSFRYHRKQDAERPRYHRYSAIAHSFLTNGSAIVGLAHDSMAVYLVVALQYSVYDEMVIDSVNFMQARDKHTVEPTKCSSGVQSVQRDATCLTNGCASDFRFKPSSMPLMTCGRLLI